MPSATTIWPWFPSPPSPNPQRTPDPLINALCDRLDEIGFAAREAFYDMAQLSVRVEELEKNTCKKYKSLIDPLHGSYIVLMEAILGAHEKCARYLFHRRARFGSVDEEIAATLLDGFSEQLRALDDPIADLRGGWHVLAASLAGELEASGKAPIRLFLWMHPRPERPWSPGQLAAQVADADNHLDLILEAHRNLELALDDMQRFEGRDERPDELHRDIGVALMVMLALDRALVSYRTHTLRAHGLLDQWPDERLCATPWRTLIATERRELLQEYSQGRDRWLKVYEYYTG
ncbi:hypothetical protein FB45DRAFT_435572 [Roridomyces roridus]|uniref:Uncharacterized protein n=1 Tax=Roridomyces roridus TaxID=1738132 RepID=A0AAD7B1L5_9AGAR|nr:hypothetical protein FB45DRAFT_435572 [Roridomyces roridus]